MGAGLYVPEGRGSWVRTWQNVDTNGGGGLLRNSPDGWVAGTDPGQLWWKGSDQLDSLLAQGSGGYRRFEKDGIVYTVPVGGGRPEAIAGVGRATSLIADQLAGLPWRQVTGHEQADAPSWVTDPQLTRPDARITKYAGTNSLSNVAFWSQAIISQLWAGMAYIWCPLRDVQGAPKAPLFIINPTEVTVRKTPRDGKAAGIWLDNAQGGPILLDPSEVIVIPGEGPYDADGVAEGLLTRYSRLFGLAEVIQAYTVGAFTAGVPAGYLKVTNPNLNEQQAQDLRTDWEGRHGGADRGIAVLNSTVDFHPIAFSPVDNALIDSGTFTLQQIALAFGLEPYMLGVPGAPDTYANITDRQQHFVTFTLMPWARRIEAALSSELPRGTDLRIDMRGLLRGDTASRYATYKVGLDGGWLTVDEVRQLEDLPPLEAPAPALPAVVPDLEPVEAVA